MKRAGALLAAAVLAAGCQEGPPPYGLERAPDQLFALEEDDLTEIDGEVVRVRRYTEFRLVSTERPDGGVNLDVYLQRFYESSETSQGQSEVAISSAGVLVREPEHGDIQLAPDDPTPTAPSLRALLEEPVAAVVLGSDGVVRGSIWHAHDPLLATVAPLGWLLLALPTLDGSEAAHWEGSREVPQLGHYRLGVQLPIQYERLAGDGDGAGAQRIRLASFTRRRGIELAQGLSGDLEVSFRGETELDGETKLAASTSELVLSFNGVDGSTIEATYRTSLRCSSCGADVNSSAPAPDPEER